MRRLLEKNHAVDYCQYMLGESPTCPQRVSLFREGHQSMTASFRPKKCIPLTQSENTADRNHFVEVYRSGQNLRFLIV